MKKRYGRLSRATSSESAFDALNLHLASLLALTDTVMAGRSNGHYRGRVHVGVDLGTAYTVLAVLDENRQPIQGAYQFAQRMV